MKVEEFAKSFVSKYIEKRYIFSERSEMKEIENEYFDDETMLDPGGDLTMNPYVYVTNGFKVKEVVFEDNIYWARMEFKIIKKCKFEINDILRCVEVSNTEKSSVGVRSVNDKLKIYYDYPEKIVSEKLFNSYVKRANYTIIDEPTGTLIE
ncbi:hypothetical protein [Leptospira santarosai]|uniref:hypothetical protein n=1 Tax=Leptospira santarosai TaxID=28183 RepID=UPI0009BA1ED5|nr:hypothetical protein [Leptospira santarosai]MBW9233927.1 hypothetical protein [Leptospira santarosai]MDO6384540.1 hypothetical protein [Leptospira santarosai]